MNRSISFGSWLFRLRALSSLGAHLHTQQVPKDWVFHNLMRQKHEEQFSHPLNKRECSDKHSPILSQEHIQTIYYGVCQGMTQSVMLPSCYHAWVIVSFYDIFTLGLIHH